MTRIVTVTPNPSLDLTYQVAGNELTDPAIEVHRADAASVEASGKGVNVSRVLARAGVQSVAVLLCGGRTGRHLTELIADDGVAYRAVPQDGETRINTTVLGGGSTTKVNAPGHAPSQKDCDNLVLTLDNELVTLGSKTGGIWVLICGSMPAGVEAGPLVQALVDCAHGRGARVAVDSSGAGLAAGLAAGADLLAPNAGELAAIGELASSSIGTAVNGGTAPDTFRAATALAAARGTELLVSLGADGALWTDGRITLHARGPVVVPVNTAGAGDALLAGWFSLPDAPPGERLGRAVLWGAATCLSPTTVAAALPGAESGAESATETGEVLLQRWSPALEAPS